MALLRGIPDGVLVEVLLLGSTNGAKQDVRDTLRSVHLDKRPGAYVVIANNSASTPGMLHRVRHLVAVRPSDQSQEKDASVRTLPSTGRADEEIAVATYTASGGASALLRISTGWSVRVEAHEDSFGLVWPTAGFIDRAASVLAAVSPDAEVIFGSSRGETTKITGRASGQLLKAAAAKADFIRYETDLLVVTWTREGRLLPAGPSGERGHEIGVGASTWDVSLMTDLMQRTAVRSVAAVAPSLMQRAGVVLERYPVGQLRSAG